MDKEEFWQKWGPLCAAEAEATLKENLFADLDQYYVDRQLAELNKIRDHLMAHVSDNSMDVITHCTQIKPYEDCAASEKCPDCDYPPERFMQDKHADCQASDVYGGNVKKQPYYGGYDCYD